MLVLALFPAAGIGDGRVVGPIANREWWAGACWSLMTGCKGVCKADAASIAMIEVPPGACGRPAARCAQITFSARRAAIWLSS